MNDNTKPSLNIYKPEDTMYGVNQNITTPDLRNLYDQNTSITQVKVSTPPATGFQAGFRITPGVTPAIGNIKDGDVWIDNVRKALIYFVTDGTYAGEYIFINKNYYLNTFRKTITGNTGQTMFYPGNYLPGGNTFIQIEKQYLNVNKSIRIIAKGNLTTTVLTTLRIQIQWSSTTIFDTGNMSIPNGLTNAVWIMDCEFIINSLDPSGSMDGTGYFQYFDGTNTKMIYMGMNNALSVLPLDGGDTTIRDNVLWGATGNTLNVTNYRVELL